MRAVRSVKGLLQDDLVRSASGVLTTNILSAGITFVVSFCLARFLGVEQYGRYTYAISWAWLLSVPAVMGLDVLLTREVACFQTRSNWKGLAGILRWSDRIVVVVSLALSVLLSVGAWFLRERAGGHSICSLGLAAVVLPSLCLTRVRQGALQGLGYVIESRLPERLISPALFLALAGGVHFSFGLNASLAVGMHAIGAFVSLLVGTYFLRQRLPLLSGNESVTYRPSEWLRSALPLMFIRASGIVIQRLPTVMLGSMVGPRAAGMYDVALRGAMLVSFILVAVNAALAPRIASLYASRRMYTLRKLVGLAAMGAFVAALPIAFGLMLFADFFLGIFGVEFVGGGLTLGILSMGQLLGTGMGPVSTLANMTGHEQFAVKINLLVVCISVILGAVLVSIWQLEGAAVANVVSLVALKAAIAVWLCRKTGINATVLSVFFD